MSTIYFTNNSDSGSGSLRQAYLDSTSGDTIMPDPNVYSDDAIITIQISSSIFNLNKDATFDAGAHRRIVIDGQNAYRFATISSESNPTASFIKFDIINCRAESCLHCNYACTLTFTECRFHDNTGTSGTYGSFISCYGTSTPKITFTNCIGYNNYGVQAGVLRGSVHANIVLSGCTFLKSYSQTNNAAIDDLAIAKNGSYVEDSCLISSVTNHNNGRKTVSETDFVDYANNDFRLSSSSQFLTGGSLSGLDFLGHTRSTSCGAYDGAWLVSNGDDTIESLENPTIVDYWEFNSDSSITVAYTGYVSVCKEFINNSQGVMFYGLSPSYLAVSDSIEVADILSWLTYDGLEIIDYGAGLIDFSFSTNNVLSWSRTNSARNVLLERQLKGVWTKVYYGLETNFVASGTSKYRVFDGSQFLYLDVEVISYFWNTNDSGEGSLRQAITTAETGGIVAPRLITQEELDAGSTGFLNKHYTSIVINLESSLPAKSMTLKGNLSTIILNGSGNTIFQFDEDATVKFERVHFYDGSQTLINNASNFTGVFDYCRFCNNDVFFMSYTACNLTFNNCVTFENTCEDTMAVIYNPSGAVTTNRCVFIDNEVNEIDCSTFSDTLSILRIVNNEVVHSVQPTDFCVSEWSKISNRTGICLNNDNSVSGRPYFTGYRGPLFLNAQSTFATLGESAYGESLYPFGIDAATYSMGQLGCLPTSCYVDSTGIVSGSYNSVIRSNMLYLGPDAPDDNIVHLGGAFNFTLSSLFRDACTAEQSGTRQTCTIRSKSVTEPAFVGMTDYASALAFSFDGDDTLPKVRYSPFRMKWTTQPELEAIDVVTTKISWGNSSIECAVDYYSTKDATPKLINDESSSIDFVTLSYPSQSQDTLRFRYFNGYMICTVKVTVYQPITRYFTNNSASGAGSLYEVWTSSNPGDIIQPDPDIDWGREIYITLDRTIGALDGRSLQSTSEEISAPNIVLDGQNLGIRAFTCTKGFWKSTLSKCRFYHWGASDINGGVIYLADRNEIKVNYCTFRYNYGSRGSAICLGDSNVTTTSSFNHCLFANNTATLVNAVFDWNNHATNSSYCTFADNINLDNTNQSGTYSKSFWTNTIFRDNAEDSVLFAKDHELGQGCTADEGYVLSAYNNDWTVRESDQGWLGSGLVISGFKSLTNVPLNVLNGDNVYFIDATLTGNNIDKLGIGAKNTFWANSTVTFAGIDKVFLTSLNSALGTVETSNTLIQGICNNDKSTSSTQIQTATVYNVSKNQALVSCGDCQNGLLWTASYYPRYYETYNEELVVSNSEFRYVRDDTKRITSVLTDIETTRPTRYLFFNGWEFYEIKPIEYVIDVSPTNVSATTKQITWTSVDSDGYLALQYQTGAEYVDYAMEPFKGESLKFPSLVGETLRLRYETQTVDVKVVEDISDVVYFTTNADSGSGSLRDVLTNCTAGAIVKPAPELIEHGQVIISLNSEIECLSTFTLDGSNARIVLKQTNNDAHFFSLSGSTCELGCKFIAVDFYCDESRSLAAVSSSSSSPLVVFERCSFRSMLANTWLTKTCATTLNIANIPTAKLVSCLVRGKVAANQIIATHCTIANPAYTTITDVLSGTVTETDNLIALSDVDSFNFVSANDFRLTSQSSYLKGATDSLIEQLDLYGNPYVFSGALGCYEGSWIVGTQTITENTTVDYVETGYYDAVGVANVSTLTLSNGACLSIRKRLFGVVTDSLKSQVVSDTSRCYLTCGNVSDLTTNCYIEPETDSLNCVIPSQYGANISKVTCESGVLTWTQKEGTKTVLIEFLNGDNWSTVTTSHSVTTYTANEDGIYRLYDGIKFHNVQTYTGSWYITTDADSGQGSLRWILTYAPDGVSIIYDSNKNTGIGDDAMKGNIKLTSPLVTSKLFTFDGYGQTGYGANCDDILLINGSVTFKPDGDSAQSGGMIANAPIAIDTLIVESVTPILSADNNAYIVIANQLENYGNLAIDNRFYPEENCTIYNNGLMTITFSYSQAFGKIRNEGILSISGWNNPLSFQVVENEGTFTLATHDSTSFDTVSNNGIFTIASYYQTIIQTFTNNGTLACSCSDKLQINNLINNDNHYMQLHTNDESCAILGTEKISQIVK